MVDVKNHTQAAISSLLVRVPFLCHEHDIELVHAADSGTSRLYTAFIKFVQNIESE